jgi:acetyltransferase-like isoleucine patch superfamily enzyme
MKSLLKLISYLNLKTLYVNFKLLPLKDAVKRSIIVSRKTKIQSLSGSIELHANIRFGMIKIGFGNVGIFDYQYERTILEIDGKIIFHGSAIIGKYGLLEIGNRFLITAHSTIICFNHILFGDNCLLSWENIIMDTDFHHVYQDNREFNQPKPIIVGDHVWIGMRCVILKGSIIADGCIIAANSLVSCNLNSPASVYGGNPAKLLKQNITWGN